MNPLDHRIAELESALRLAQERIDELEAEKLELEAHLRTVLMPPFLPMDPDKVKKTLS